MKTDNTGTGFLALIAAITFITVMCVAGMVGIEREKTRQLELMLQLQNHATDQ